MTPREKLRVLGEPAYRRLFLGRTVSLVDLERRRRRIQEAHLSNRLD